LTDAAQAGGPVAAAALAGWLLLARPVLLTEGPVLVKVLV